MAEEKSKNSQTENNRGWYIQTEAIRFLAKRIEFKSSKRFQKDDHLYQLTVSPTKKEQQKEPPLMINQDKSILTVFQKLLEDLQRFYRAGKISPQVYLVLEHKDLLKAKFFCTGNFSLFNENHPPSKWARFNAYSCLERVKALLQSNEHLTFSNNLFITFTVLSLEHRKLKKRPNKKAATIQSQV